MNNVESGSAASEATYDKGAVILHWLVALFVVVLGPLGLYMETIDGKAQNPWVNFHGCIGLVFLVLVLARLAWRVGRPPPPLPAGTGALVRWTSTPVHWLLYGLMLAIAVPGFIAFVWHGRTFDYNLFSLNFGIASNRNVFKPAENIHGLIAYGLMGLASLHAAAALFHHFILKDSILRRMIPFLKA